MTLRADRGSASRPCRGRADSAVALDRAVDQLVDACAATPIIPIECAPQVDGLTAGVRAIARLYERAAAPRRRLLGSKI